METLEAMRLFVRICERSSFKYAANEFGFSPSKVTKAIQQLEERLGIQILQRTTRRVSPTDAGGVYYEQCVKILQAIDQAEFVHRGVDGESTIHTKMIEFCQS
jgi:DNA-binding transcriptional LysR family regulator